MPTRVHTSSTQRRTLKTTPYRRGKKFEHHVVSHLESLGWAAFRVSVSGRRNRPAEDATRQVRPALDIIALGHGRVALIEVRRDGVISPRERDDLCRIGNGRVERYVVRSYRRRLQARDVVLWRSEPWRVLNEIF